MTNHAFLSALDHFVTSAAANSHSRAHINRLQVSSRAAWNQVAISLASIQSSLLLMAEAERANSLRPTALLPESLVAGTEPRLPSIWWDVYPALKNSIRLGEIQAADQREAIEKAAKKFEQAPAMLIVMRRA
jgi:hypothetical protein